MLNWCRGKETSTAPFRMPVDDAFGLTVPNKVVVVGVVAEGELRPGIDLLLQTESHELTVTAEALEANHRRLKLARQGDRVGVMLAGAVKEQVAAGAFLVSVES